MIGGCQFQWGESLLQVEGTAWVEMRNHVSAWRINYRSSGAKMTSNEAEDSNKSTSDEGPSILGPGAWTSPRAWETSEGFGYGMGRSAFPDSY